MLLAAAWNFLGILSWVHVRFSALRNDSFLGGSPSIQKESHASGGFGFWPSDDNGNDHFGGGGSGGKWDFKSAVYFSRPHPIESFRFAEDKLETSLKALNEQHYLPLEWHSILQSYISDEFSSQSHVVSKIATDSIRCWLKK